MKFYRLYSLLLILIALNLRAQDPHFSQFNEQPSLINPALTGMDDPIRISGVFKNQWQSVTTPYTTYGASLESRIKPGGWKSVDSHRGMTFKERGLSFLNIGLSIYRDNAGSGILDLTQANLSLASFIPTGRKSFLSCGLQGSFAQRKINNASLLFPNQFNGSSYDPGMASNENFGSQNFNNFDLAAGLVWSFKNKQPLTDHELTKVNIGFSVFHINAPKQNFLVGNKDLLHAKYVLYGDFLFSAPGSRVAFSPRFLAQMQGASQEVMLGMIIKSYVGGGSKYTGIVKSSSIGYGMYYRFGDAIVPTITLEWKEQYAVGFSYDINVSRLSGTSSGRGGPEIMLRYTPPRAFLYQMKDDKTGQGKSK